MSEDKKPPRMIDEIAREVIAREKDPTKAERLREIHRQYLECDDVF